MPDYGRPLEFGVSVAPNAAELATVFETAAAADQGLDLIGVQDHPYQRRFIDTMHLLGALAGRTTRLRVFPDVACLPLRPPAMLANEAAAIDILSGGRFELGLGAGAFWDAIAGMGGPRRTPSEALEALEEAVDVIRLMWSGERGLRYHGQHYSVAGVHSGPRPRHEIEIWFGVYGPRACELLGRVADGWIPSLGRTPLEELISRHEIIDDSARESGRRPTEIRRLVNLSGTITDRAGRGFLEGPPDQWVDQLTGLVLSHGFDTFIFWPEAEPVSQVSHFAEIATEVRATIARERA